MNNLYYGVPIESSLPSLHLISRSRTAAKAIWLRKTSLHHCSAHSSKIDRTFDREPHCSANTDTVTSAPPRVTRSDVTNYRTNSHGKWVSGYRTNPLRYKFFSVHAYVSSWKRVSDHSNPLHPSSRPVAPSPARKKSKSSNGENREIARALSIHRAKYIHHRSRPVPLKGRRYA